MNYKLVLYILKIVVGVLLIYWLLDSGKFDISVLSKLSTPFYLLFLVLIYFVALIFSSTRWFLINRFYKLDSSWIKCIKLYLVSMFFYFFVPAGSVGSDFVKGYYLIKTNRENKIKSVMSILMDKYFAFYSMLLMTLIVLFFNYNNELKSVFLIVVLLFILSSIALLLGFVHDLSIKQFVNKYFYFLPKQEFLFTLHKCFSTFVKTPSLTFIVILLSCISYLMYVFIFAVAGTTMGFEIDFWVYMYAVPLTLLIASIPIAPGGIGVGQVAALSIFGLISENSNLGPSTVTAYQLSGMLLGLIGFVFYIKLKD